jgi:hypothetical protein
MKRRTLGYLLLVMGGIAGWLCAAGRFDRIMLLLAEAMLDRVAPLAPFETT